MEQQTAETSSQLKRLSLNDDDCPPELRSHELVGDLILHPMSPEEICKKYFSGQRDTFFEDLKSEFLKVCSDFDDPITSETRSHALHFFQLIILDLGPERNPSNKKYREWILSFPNQRDNGPAIKSKVYVSELGNYLPQKEAPKFVNNCLRITLNQARLLATHSLSKLVMGIPEEPYFKLTPFSMAIFSKDVINKICHELNPGYDNAYKASVICSINESCLFDSYYLSNSKSYIALLFCLLVEKRSPTRQRASSIVNNTLKEYLKRDKPFDMEKYSIYAKYANEDVPVVLPSDVLMILNNYGKPGLSRRQ